MRSSIKGGLMMGILMDSLLRGRPMYDEPNTKRGSVALEVTTLHTFVVHGHSIKAKSKKHALKLHKEKYGKV